MKQLDFDTLIKCVKWDKQTHYVGEMNKVIMSGSPDDFLLIPDADYYEAMQSLEARRLEEERLLGTARRNNEGTELEKSGRIDDAIAVYEENIKVGYPASHSYERLMILYRKRKEYDQEIRVILRAIEVFASAGTTDLLFKYNDRLEKATELLSRQKQ